MLLKLHHVGVGLPLARVQDLLVVGQAIGAGLDCREVCITTEELKFRFISLD